MNKKKSPITGLRFLAAALIASGYLAGLAHAQIPETPEQEAASTLTPYQIARDKAVHQCLLQYHQQNAGAAAAPAAAFMQPCIQGQGVTEPPPLTAAAATVPKK